MNISASVPFADSVSHANRSLEQDFRSRFYCYEYYSFQFHAHLAGRKSSEKSAIRYNPVRASRLSFSKAWQNPGRRNSDQRSPAGLGDDLRSSDRLGHCKPMRMGRASLSARSFGNITLNRHLALHLTRVVNECLRQSEVNKWAHHHSLDSFDLGPSCQDEQHDCAEQRKKVFGCMRDESVSAASSSTQPF